jgi:hypothetical protein
LDGSRSYRKKGVVNPNNGVFRGIIGGILKSLNIILLEWRGLQSIIRVLVGPPEKPIKS